MTDAQRAANDALRERLEAHRERERAAKAATALPAARERVQREVELAREVETLRRTYDAAVRHAIERKGRGERDILPQMARHEAEWQHAQVTIGARNAGQWSAFGPAWLGIGDEQL